MARSISATLGVAKRQASIRPEGFVPPLILPLMFFAAFAGGLSSIAETPDFPYPDYTGFIWVFVLFMAACFVSVFKGFSMATDFERGFANRLMLAAPNRLTVVFGFAVASMLQALIVISVLFAIGVLVGMDVSANPIELAAIVALALLVNLATMLFAAGVSVRLQAVQTASLLTIMPVFMLLFVAPVYLPREQLSGWLEPASAVNPFTALFEATRDLLVGAPDAGQVAVAFGVVGALIAVFLVWALSGIRRLGR